METRHKQTEYHAGVWPEDIRQAVVKQVRRAIHHEGILDRAIGMRLVERQAETRRVLRRDSNSAFRCEVPSQSKRILNHGSLGFAIANFPPSTWHGPPRLRFGRADGLPDH